DMLAGDEAAFARGGNQDVRGLSNAGQVDRVRVGDGHGGMVLKEQERQRAPDQAGASHDDGALAGGIDSFAPEQLQDAEGRGWNEGWVALGQAAGVVGVETVDIFTWWYPLERLMGVEAIRERHLDEDAVDRG